jgi:hypothetical protein
MTDRPHRLPHVEAKGTGPAGPVDLSSSIMLCTFRLCDWQSPDVRTLALDETDQIVAAHLLDAHRRELATLGLLARDHGLFR